MYSHSPIMTRLHLKTNSEVCSQQQRVIDFLELIAKFRKASNTLAISVCLSASMEQLGFHWVYFHEVLFLTIFRNHLEKIKVELKCDKNNRHFTQRPMNICNHIFINSTQNKNCFRQSHYRPEVPRWFHEVKFLRLRYNGSGWR